MYADLIGNYKKYGIKSLYDNKVDVKFAKQRPVKRNGKIVKKGTVLMAWGTQQHKECFYSRLIKTPTWTFKKEKGVLVDNVDEFFNSGLWLEFKTILNNLKNECRLADAKEFYYQHEEEMKFNTLWSEFWDCLELALDYYENPNSFKQEVQGDVDAIGEKWFKQMHTETREEIEQHEFIKTMLIVDPAASSGRKSDYTAYLVGSSAKNGYKYGRRGELAKINARQEFDKYINHMIELLLQYPDITHISIEKNTFNGADANQLEKAIKEHEVLKYRNLVIINESQRKNKDDKISTIVPFVNRGEFVFCSEDEEFINQFMEFAGQKFTVHDDAADTASELWLRLDNIKQAATLKFYDRSYLGL